MSLAVLRRPALVDALDEGWARPVTRHDRRVDVAIAAALAAAAGLTSALFATTAVGDLAPVPVVVAWVVLIAVPLAWRRRFPATVASVVAVVYIAGQLVRVPDQFVGQVALILALYTVGAWGPDRRAALVVRVVIAVEFALWIGIAVSSGALSDPAAWSPFPAVLTLEILINSVVIGATLVFGEVGWVAARRLAALEARTAELVRERRRTAEQAAAIERMRIARELHDVVAHHVSVMGLQAAAARRLLATSPDRAASALGEVETNARRAIEEMRGILVALRSDGPDEPAEGAGVAASTVGLQRLGALVAEARQAGTPTGLDVQGDTASVPAVTGLALYRVAQEALTNVRKHGGRGASAQVRLRVTPEAADLTVTSTGGAGSTGAAGSGLGQVGMRERMAAVGGALRTGPEGSGYVVHATVPLRVTVG